MNIRNETEFVEALRGTKPLMVDFWAPWCAPCRMLAPTVEEVEKELEGELTVASVNVDECPGIAQRYGIASIPTLLLFAGGSVVGKSVGLVDKDRILALVRSAVGR